MNGKKSTRSSTLFPGGVLAVIPVRGLMPAGLLLAVLLPMLCWAQSQADPEAAAGRRRIEPVVTSKAMAVTANPHATRAALELLRAGGNAVDAAAAAQYVLNVVEPQSSGIGGGGFMLIYLAAENRVIAIDGREEAPAAASPTMFLRPDGTPQPFYPERITGGRAVGVPGLVMALEKALRLHGKLGRARVLAPAIRLAGEGFAVSARLAALLKRDKKRLALFPATRALFFNSRGETLGQGELLRQPELAATFRLLAAGGAEAFYQGAIARDIVRAVRQAPVNPGLMTTGDLAGYRAPLRRPVQGSYRGYTIYGMGPPSSGGVTLIQIMQLMERAPTPPEAERETEREAIRDHKFVQAVRLAYADRGRYLADADFAAVPVKGLLDEGYATSRAAALNWEAPLGPVEPGLPEGAAARAGADTHRESPSTTHLTVVDEQRNVVALTSSIEMAFGSGMVVAGRGFLLNNQLTDFSPRPREPGGREIANRVEGGKKPRATALDNPGALGGKRPRSSMAPTLVLREGRLVMALGSPGGSRIIQYVARVLLRVLDGRQSLQEAISAPHLTHLGGKTYLEKGGSWATIRPTLEKLGHDIRITEQTSGLHGIRIDPTNGSLNAGVDPRREGAAAGF